MKYLIVARGASGLAVYVTGEPWLAGTYDLALGARYDTAADAESIMRIMGIIRHGTWHVVNDAEELVAFLLGCGSNSP